MKQRCLAALLAVLLVLGGCAPGASSHSQDVEPSQGERMKDTVADISFYYSSNIDVVQGDYSGNYYYYNDSDYFAVGSKSWDPLQPFDEEAAIEYHREIMEKAAAESGVIISTVREVNKLTFSGIDFWNFELKMELGTVSLRYSVLLTQRDDELVTFMLKCKSREANKEFIQMMNGLEVPEAPDETAE